MDSDFRELDDWTTKLGRSGTLIMPLVDTAVRKAAADTVADAKALVPVRTGNLKNSISSRSTSGHNYVEAEIGPTANYGKYVEFGTSRQAPKPYLRPAFKRNTEALERALRSVTKDALK